MNKLILTFIILLAVRAGAQAPALAVADSLFAVGEKIAVEELEGLGYLNKALDENQDNERALYGRASL